MIQKATPTFVRCAVYARKSTDEGLDSDFNSLDNQRERAEAYIRSQDGWVALPERYDDGGFSGATTDRPALQRLLHDMDAGAFDCLVVYRTDRLSRSILDFLRLLEHIEAAGVAYVSVTESFSTGTPAGRLMMHLLLSFAEYERQVISERTRDKVHAARRRGRFTGSTPPLGYDIAPEGGRLVVNPVEAERAREIFALYLKHDGLLACVQELNRRNWRTKSWTSKKGRTIGGTAFTRTSLHALLVNHALVGKVKFQGEVYDAEHEGIVDLDTWDRVQEKLRSNGNGNSTRRSRHPAPLAGLLWCAACGGPMTFTYTSRGPKRYCYYKCSTAQKQGKDACPTEALPAAEIEQYVADELGKIGQDDAAITETARQAREMADVEIRRLKGERAVLVKTLKGLGENIREAATAPPDGSNGARMSALQTQIATAQGRISQIGQEIDAAHAGRIGESDLRRALADFDGLWKEMTPDERARTLNAVIEKVAYDGQAGTVSITFRPTGIRALAGEPR